MIQPEGIEKILTSEAVSFLNELHRKFESRRKELLDFRMERQKRLDAGELPDFLMETGHVREANWKIAPIPADIQDRRVEITGPVERKMIINALNSGAKVFMADFEDSHSPTWEATIQGQLNLIDAVKGTITFQAPGGKEYKLKANPAVLFVRPRGWHLTEKHFQVDGKRISASLFDFGLYFFHNAKALVKKKTGPYFYLPKMESHSEARLWNDVFVFAQKHLDLPLGTIKATCLIETIMAAFEMDEILYELRDHSAGLNCGRWDYIFSMIKRLKSRKDFVLPDRAQVTMTTHCMRSYSLLTIQTCHRRGAHAMGGMAAQIPIKSDEKANEEALAKVRADKKREVADGHDGTWVAHPGLVAIALEEFDTKMPTPNQIHVARDDVSVTQKDLLTVPEGKITEEGLRTNIRVGVQYLSAWLNGNGCVPLYNLMEDAATAEISRTQVWQWIQRGKFSKDKFEKVLQEEVSKFPESKKHSKASKLFKEIVLSETLDEFLTLRAYEELK
jgi:malate synthase